MRSDRQTLTTFGTATRENLTSCTSGHTRTKTVGPLTMNFARLISALHAETRRESRAKTSTWWPEKKGGKGTQRSQECQAKPFTNAVVSS